MKTIKICGNYQANIESVESEQRLTSSVIQNIYNRFMSESNLNHLHSALDALEGYRYVPRGFSIPSGRYIRYIDTTQHNDMPLKLGGFVLSDNGYSVVFKSSGFTERVVRLNKKHCIMFVKITEAELLRLQLGDPT